MTIPVTGKKVLVLDSFVRGHRQALDSEFPFHQDEVAETWASRSDRTRA